MPIDPDDIPVLVSLFSKFSRAFDERTAAQKLAAEANARVLAADVQVKKVSAALSIYGLDTGTPGWSRVIEELAGPSAYLEAQRKAGRVAPTLSDNSVHEEAAPLAGASIRETVLDRLRVATSHGANARSIRQYIERLRGTKLHEKTVGMTLYRLSQEGLARREGRIWFFVPEAKNPGGETPGLFNRDDKKEGKA
jgi:hypothetical protein